MGHESDQNGGKEGLIGPEDDGSMMLEADDLAEEVSVGNEDEVEVVEDNEDNSERVFNFHEGPVYSCDLHPNMELGLAAAASGDDSMTVWDLKGEGRLVFRCADFKDSVVHVRFNKDGAYLAAADLAGAVKVWKLAILEADSAGGSSSSGNGSTGGITLQEIFQFEASEATWMEWHSGTNVMFLGTRESELWMWKIPSGEAKVFMGGGDKVECARLTPDGRKMWVGYADGSLKLFDLRAEGQCLHNLTDNLTSHSPRAVMSIATHNSLMASGCVAGVAKVFNTTSGKNVGIFAESRAAGSSGARGPRSAGTLPADTSESCPDGPDPAESSGDPAEASVAMDHGNEGEGDHEDEGAASDDDSWSLESVLFAPDNPSTLVTGSLDGRVTAWDLSTQVVRGSVDLWTGVVKMEWRNSLDKGEKGSAQSLIVATLDGQIYLLDMRSFQVLAAGAGHTLPILDFAQSRDGRLVLTASDDKQVRLFDLDKLIEIHRDREVASPESVDSRSRV